MPPLHRRDDAAIDRWIETSLRDRYKSTLREPVPEFLIKLLGTELSGN